MQTQIAANPGRVEEFAASCRVKWKTDSRKQQQQRLPHLRMKTRPGLKISCKRMPNLQHPAKLNPGRHFHLG